MSDSMQRIDQFEQLARGLGDATDETTRLQLAAVAAVQLIAGCDHAGVTVNENGAPLTRAASDDVVAPG